MRLECQLCLFSRPKSAPRLAVIASLPIRGQALVMETTRPGDIPELDAQGGRLLSRTCGSPMNRGSRSGPRWPANRLAVGSRGDGPVGCAVRGGLFRSGRAGMAGSTRVGPGGKSLRWSSASYSSWDLKNAKAIWWFCCRSWTTGEAFRRSFAMSVDTPLPSGMIVIVEDSRHRIGRLPIGGLRGNTVK